MSKKHIVSPFEGATQARPAKGLDKAGLASLRRLIKDKSHAPLKALKSKIFPVISTCPTNGVQIKHEDIKTWVAAEMLEPA